MAGMPSSRLTMAAWQVRPPLVRNDPRHPLHDRHPVGVGHFSYQDGIVFHLVDVVGTENAADFTGGDRIPNAQSCQNLLPLLLQLIGTQGAGGLLGLHRLGSGLDDKQLAGFAILGPLHIHGLAVVGFDGAGPAPQLQNFVVLQHKATPLLAGGFHRRGSFTALVGVNHFLFFAAPLLLHDGLKGRFLAILTL